MMQNRENLESQVYRLYVYDRDLFSLGFTPPIGQPPKVWTESGLPFHRFTETRDAFNCLQECSGRWTLPDEVNWDRAQVRILLGLQSKTNIVYLSKDEKLTLWGFIFFPWVA